MLNLPMSTFPQQFRTTVLLDYWFTVGKEGKKTLFSILLSSLGPYIILTRYINKRKTEFINACMGQTHSRTIDEYLKGVAKTGTYIIS